jgi:protein phosphatase
VSSGDRLLLCSDGLTGMVTEGEITDVLSSELDPAAAARRLVETANQAGGIDNVTALVVDVVDDEDATASLPAVQPAPAEEPPAVEPAPPAGRVPLRQRRWFRILRWALPILLVVGVGLGVVAWYARNTYYVGSDLGNVAIFRGRQGGVLIWNPTLEQRTNVLVNDLPPQQRQQVKGGHGQFSSLGDARAYVRQLRRRAVQHPTPTTAAPPTT